MLEMQFVFLALLIALSAFFSGDETALVSTSMVKAKTLLRQKKKHADTLYRLKQNPHKLIITILIGNNLVNIGSASLATVLFTEMFGSSGIGMATGIMTFLILVFGEITPKTYCAQNAERISLMVARPIEILSIVLSPLVVVFEVISKAMSRVLGSKKEQQISEDELRTIVTMGRQEGILGRETARIMQNVIEFEETKVTDIMTPKSGVEMIDGEMRLKDVISYVVRTPYSRYPVYVKDTDNIVGILDIDDVLMYAQKNRLGTKIRSIVRKAYFVPETKEIDDLLKEFEGSDTPIAVVVDEYGHVSGVVTVEDILEEIVGEIFDKSQKESDLIKKMDRKSIRADARATIEEVNRALNLDFKKKRFNTIAGLIEHMLKRIPRKGEVIKLKKAIIEIEDATEKEIKRVRIIKR